MGIKNHILEYIKGNRRGRKAHRLEREALNDPFLHDALEGLEQPGDHRRAIGDLRQQLNKHVEVDTHHLRRAWRQSQRYSAVLIPAMIAVALVAAPVVFLSQREEPFSLADYQHTFELEEEALPIYSGTPPAPPQAPDIPFSDADFIVIDDDVRIADQTIAASEDAVDEGQGNAVAVQMEEYMEAKPEEEAVADEDIPFATVEEKPKFMGGDANEFSKWVFKNLAYPESAKERHAQGRVVVEFVVAVDGQIENVKVLRSIDPALDNEAVRVISMSPKWTPGMQRGKPVRVRYIFPVNFILK